MSDKIPIDLNVLSETALITLWAKGTEYGRRDALLEDAQAARLLALIDYDFSKFDKAVMSQVGCCARAALIDGHVRRFLARYPDGVVIQLGCGLDARYERLGSPPLTAWYDLDLPEIMQIRGRLLPPNGNRYLSGSLFDTGWMQTVKAHGKPVLVLLEGVLMYFEESRVKQFFIDLAGQLPRAEVVFDSLPPLLLRRAKKHDALRTMGKNIPEFRWAPKEFDMFAHWHDRLHIAGITCISSICIQRYPWFARWLFKLRRIRENSDQRIVHVVLS
ncbi:class I SAM-dependent methyltransferase [Neisseria dentiae]|uniref:class I SAM-dependent methyltransferase n=1 Tax=Neisseria dentiae TaxID=194197 RepID=UPI00359FD4E0